MSSVIEREARLRHKNQLTLPEEIARRLGAEPGDRFVWVWDESTPDRVSLRRLRRSYYGALKGLYGQTPQEVAAYIQGERESWGEQ